MIKKFLSFSTLLIIIFSISILLLVVIFYLGSFYYASSLKIEHNRYPAIEKQVDLQNSIISNTSSYSFSDHLKKTWNFSFAEPSYGNSFPSDDLELICFLITPQKDGKITQISLRYRSTQQQSASENIPSDLSFFSDCINVLYIDDPNLVEELQTWLHSMLPTLKPDNKTSISINGIIYELEYRSFLDSQRSTVNLRKLSIRKE